MRIPDQNINTLVAIDEIVDEERRSSSPPAAIRVNDLAGCRGALVVVGPGHMVAGCWLAKRWEKPRHLTGTADNRPRPAGLAPSSLNEEGNPVEAVRRLNAAGVDYVPMSARPKR